MPCFEHTGDGELFQTRQDSGRRHLPLRDDDGQFVARADTQNACEFLADGDVEGTGLQVAEFSVAELPGDIGHVGFFRGIDAAHDDAAHEVVSGDECLSDHIRSGTGHVRMRADMGGGFLPVGQRAVDILYLDMRQNRKHPVPHFFLEAVHDGQDDDERSHAQCDTGHRDERDEGNEAVPAAAFSGTDITQTDKPLERQIGKQFQCETPGKTGQFAIYSPCRHIQTVSSFVATHDMRFGNGFPDGKTSAVSI